jgi:hypothetical protein
MDVRPCDPDRIPASAVEGRISFTGMLSRHQAVNADPRPGPRWLSREWFGGWLSAHPDGIAFIDAHFDEAALRAGLAAAAAGVP